MACGYQAANDSSLYTRSAQSQAPITLLVLSRRSKTFTASGRLAHSNPWRASAISPRRLSRRHTCSPGPTASSNHQEGEEAHPESGSGPAAACAETLHIWHREKRVGLGGHLPGFLLATFSIDQRYKAQPPFVSPLIGAGVPTWRVCRWSRDRSAGPPSAGRRPVQDPAAWIGCSWGSQAG